MSDREIVRDVLCDLLSLVEDAYPGEPVSEAEVATWTDDEVHEVSRWALATHMAASDNAITVPVLPLTLKARTPYPGAITPLDQIQDT